MKYICHICGCEYNTEGEIVDHVLIVYLGGSRQTMTPKLNALIKQLKIYEVNQ